MSATVALGGLATLAVAGCGGQRQDANEPSGTFPVAITRATFPATQSLAAHPKMAISVRNAGTKAIPDVAVTLVDPRLGTQAQAFAVTSDQPELASRSRPVWIVDRGPVSGDTAYSNTWALGRLKPGATRTFLWAVTPVQAGRYTIEYRVAAGLNGKARARLAGGGVPRGLFHVHVCGQPAQAIINGSGQVVREPAPCSK
jgi:hypothetical protein